MNGSTQIRSRPTNAAKKARRLEGGVATAVIASSGRTRAADHAGNRLAHNAVSIEPPMPSSTPPRLSTTPALKILGNFIASKRVQNQPSGTPAIPPMIASTTPSRTTNRPICPRNAPIARSIARVRDRSATPMLNAEKIMNIAASIDTAEPR